MTASQPRPPTPVRPLVLLAALVLASCVRAAAAEPQASAKPAGEQCGQLRALLTRATTARDEKPVAPVFHGTCRAPPAPRPRSRQRHPRRGLHVEWARRRGEPMPRSVRATCRPSGRKAGARAEHDTAVARRFRHRAAPRAPAARSGERGNRGRRRAHHPSRLCSPATANWPGAWPTRSAASPPEWPPRTGTPPSRSRPTCCRPHETRVSTRRDRSRRVGLVPGTNIGVPRQWGLAFPTVVPTVFDGLDPDDGAQHRNDTCRPHQTVAGTSCDAVAEPATTRRLPCPETACGSVRRERSAGGRRRRVCEAPGTCPPVPTPRPSRRHRLRVAALPPTSRGSKR